MSNKRQDSWTSEEDQLLVDTILRFIKEKRTQIEAFNEVGEKLNRTSAACGFRWNSVLRKQYTKELELAKKKSRSSNNIKREDTPEEDSELTFQEVMIFLNNMYKKSKKVINQTELEDKIKEMEEELEQLRNENEHLKEENKNINKILGNLRTMLTSS